MPKFKAILFDLDGTLIDAFPPIIYGLRQTLKEFGCAAMSDKDIRRFTGDATAKLEDLFGSQAEAARERYITLHDEVYLQQLEPLAGAVELLQELQQRQIKTAIVSNKGHHRALAQLKVLQWLDYFSAIYGRCDDYPQKPHPASLHLACQSLAVAAEDSLMLGDGPADMQAGQRAGCYPCGIVSHFSVQELQQAGAKRCFQHLHEAKTWIIKHL